MEPLLISRGSTFWPFLVHVCFVRRPKTGPSTYWIRTRLGGAVLRSPKNLLESRCPLPELHQITQPSTEISNKGLEQGRPPTPSPKKLSILEAKNEPFKNLPCTRLSKPLASLAVMKLMNKCQTSSRTERGRRGLAEASPRPRLGRKTYWHRDKARLTETRNYIKLLLESQQPSTPNEYGTLLPRQNFKPQLAQSDGLKAGFGASRLWRLW